MVGTCWGFGFDAGDWWWGRRGFGRGRRGRIRFEAGDMKYVILKLLKSKPMHGYEVMKELEERTRGCYKPSPGTVYPTLQWLEDEELVKSEEVEGKKIYSITEQGLRFLEEHKSTVEDIFDRVEDALDSLLSDPMPEVTRLVGKVVGQTYRVAWRYRDDKDQAKAIAKILQGTLEELERMGAEAREEGK